MFLFFGRQLGSISKEGGTCCVKGLTFWYSFWLCAKFVESLVIER